MVSGLNFRSNGPGLSPVWGNWIVFLGKALYSHNFFFLVFYYFLVPLSTQVDKWHSRLHNPFFFFFLISLFQ